MISADEAGSKRCITCGSCGDRFECGVATPGCWCAEIDLSGSMLEELAARFSDCLCGKCLSKYSAEDAKRRNY